MSRLCDARLTVRQLGLYLCKKLAELQGGEIRHSSVPRQGAAFTFFIEARKVLEAGLRSPLPSARANSAHPRPSQTTPIPTPTFSPTEYFQSTGVGNGFEVPRATMVILIAEDNVWDRILRTLALVDASYRSSINNSCESNWRRRDSRPLQRTMA